jgi:hypothetical protein
VVVVVAVVVAVFLEVDFRRLADFRPVGFPRAPVEGLAVRLIFRQVAQAIFHRAVTFPSILRSHANPGGAVATLFKTTARA